MSNKIGWKEIRLKLNRMSERDLIGLIGDLYKLNKGNESYLKAKFFDDKETYLKYTNKIKSCLVVEPFEKKPKLAEAKKIISDYKKANGNTEGLVNLMLHYLYCGKIMAELYGYYENGFYGSMESMYRNTKKLILDNPSLDSKYEDKLNSLSEKYKKVGWEFT
jgi:hypothetical protein